MPNDDLKRLVREEMARTRERYSVARARLLSQRDRLGTRPLRRSVVAKLREARARGGWTRHRAARELGVGPLWVWLVETGTPPPPALADRLVRLYALDHATAKSLRRTATARAATQRALQPRTGSFDGWANTFTAHLRSDSGAVVLRYVAIDGDVIWAAESTTRLEAGSRGSITVGTGTPSTAVIVQPARPDERARARALLSARYPGFVAVFEHSHLLKIQASQRHDSTPYEQELSCPPSTTQAHAQRT